MIRHLAALASLLAFFLVLPAVSSAEGLGEMRISLLEGDVQVRSADTEDWIPTSVNYPVLEGDSVWVPEGGRLEIQLRNGTAIRLNEQTAMDVLRVEPGATQLYLSSGQVFVNFRGLRKDLMQIDTPVSSVRTYNKAVFRVDVSLNGFTDASVYQGVVYAEGRGGKTRISANKMVSIEDDGYSELTVMGPADDWERWNRARDRRYSERLYSSNYLPDELDGYSSDLDENGKWINVPDYGYVWTPTVVVSAGWAPYRLGRWVWLHGDYVWISYESWGWAPYHYGRWAHVPRYGWCWVPPRRGSVYWGPGYVGWVHTSNDIAWVPLAPGELYYGHGYYGPNSVNIVNINIQKTVVYKNVHISNAVSVVNTDTFIHGRGAPRPAGENLFINQKATFGAPQIKPVRSMMMPVVKEVPKAKLPPPKVQSQASEAKFRELRETRPVVRQPQGSLFGGGAAGQAAPSRSFRETPQAGPKTPAVQQAPSGQAAKPGDRSRSGGFIQTPKQQGGQQQPAPAQKPGASGGFIQTPKQQGGQQQPAPAQKPGASGGFIQTPKKQGGQQQPAPAQKPGERSGGFIQAPSKQQQGGQQQPAPAHKPGASGGFIQTPKQQQGGGQQVTPAQKPAAVQKPAAARGKETEAPAKEKKEEQKFKESPSERKFGP